MFDGNELRAVLLGGDPAAAAKLGWLQRLLLKLAQISQLTRNIDALRLLSKVWMPLSQRVVIIGGGLVGLELAEYLVERGREVTVLEPSNNLGAELSIVRRARVIHELRNYGARLLCNINVRRIGQGDIEFTDQAGELQSCPAPQVIIALGAKPDRRLAEQLTQAGINVVSAGDCQQIGYIEGAILSGREAALGI